MIYITFCVDWEGEHFRNLRDLKYLLLKMGNEVPVTHFICPAYFYHYPKQANKKILSVIRAQDEIGLHVHCYKSLIQNIPDIQFKVENNYYKKNDPLIQLRDKILGSFTTGIKKRIMKTLVSGRGVPLSVYSNEEIKRIVKHSKELLLNKLKLDKLTSFRAGGWIASDDVFDVLAESGFSIDSSAVPPEILSNGYERNFVGTNKDDFNEAYPCFTGYIKNLWGAGMQDVGFLKNNEIHSYLPSKYITKNEQPFYINQILEMPNNCGATDFASMEKTLMPALNWALKENAKHYNKLPFVINLTCHQEGDFFYKKGLYEFFEYIKNIQTSEIQFTTVTEAAKNYKKCI